MKTIDLLQLSFRSISSYRLRSMLSILGIAIGVVSVVLLTSIGKGIHRYVLTQFTQFGTNIIAIVPGKTTTLGISGAAINNVRPLTLGDAQALSRLENIIATVPIIQGNAQVEANRKTRRTFVLGVGHKVPEVWKLDVAAGKFLPDDNYSAARPFAVLGSKLRDELFGRKNPLGQIIRIGDSRYRIIGTMQTKGQMLGFDMDDVVYIPTRRAMEIFNRESLMELDILFKATSNAEQVSGQIKRLLTRRHGHQDFTIVTQDQMLELLDTVLNILTLAVGALGGVSLVVGAIGILTIMTIAISERVSEIGLLRAVGAEQLQIVGIFLGEAVLLSGTGGMSGVLIGIGTVAMVSALVPELPISMAWGYIGAALCLSVLIGLLAGVIPALRAANMQPLDALRSE